MSQTATDELADFLADLVRQDLAPKTIATYKVNLTAFAQWFATSLDQPFAARAVTPSDLRDYRAHLRTVQRRAAATVNRRLAALRPSSVGPKARG